MTTTADTLPPPVGTTGAWGWLRRNLFSTWYNSLLTVAALWLAVSVALAVASTLAEADWGVIAANLRLFMVGRYPSAQVWRVQACVSLLAFLLGASWAVWRGFARTAAVAVGAFFLVLALLPGEDSSRLWLAGNLALIVIGFGAGRLPHARRVLALAWLAALIVAGILLYGIGAEPLLTVYTDLWGGLLLTFALALAGIVFSFPLGVALAVGRQSSYPVMRAFCVLYIEVVRGVPLVTILFMMQIMMPLFLAEGMTVERVVRAMAGFAVFTAAYLAENVRGGLQSIGRGQGEAARALGLNGLQALWLIILPQALRAVIPAMVGQFISLFKDTSLVAIVGLLDLTGVGNSVTQQAAYLNRRAEVYIFLAAVYFVVSYSMSHASRRLEKTLGVGER
jgi:general L-amino acid transport system permease protein